MTTNNRQPWWLEKGTRTRLVLLRHGEVEEGARNRLYGQEDVALSPRGMEQSRAAGEALRPHGITAVYTSDLQRASVLGASVAGHHGLTITPDPRLRERRFGDWQGLSWDVIEDTRPDELRAYHADRFRYRVPGDSENFEDVRARVLQFLNEVLPRHPGETIAITAHSGSVRILLAEAMGMPLDSIFTFEQDYCCLNVIDYFESGRRRVERINDTHHLGGIA